jgi:hypothetical protein
LGAEEQERKSTMKSETARIVSVVVLGLLTLACAKSVVLETPAAGIAGFSCRAQELTFRFHPRYARPTFAAVVDGVSLTDRDLSPLSAPGGVSTAMPRPYSHTPVSVHVAGGMSPFQYFDVTGYSTDFIPPPLTLMLPPAPAPAPCSSSSPCATVGGSSILTLRDTQTATVTVYAPCSPAAPVAVTITPDHNFVALDPLLPAGTPIIVTIPASDRRASFQVHAIQQGVFTLTASSPGYLSTLLRGNVIP